MAAQKGKDMLLKLASAAPPHDLVTVAGLRTRKIALNSETVDITDSESAGRWRELLGGAGMRRASVSGAGIFKDQASDEEVRAVFFSAATRTWQLVIPDFGTLEGPFQLVALDYAGNHDGEVTFDMALESAGALSFTVTP